MKANKNLIIAATAGVLLGYMFQRTLDDIPLIKDLPKIDVRGS
jgi:hypothetical protein